MANALVITLFLVAAGTTPGGEWAKPVRGLTGRLIVESVVIHVRLAVELENDGSLPFWVTTHSPFTFDLVVKNADGVDVKPDAERADITSAPHPAIVPSECRLTMPVTISQVGWNLDVVTYTWQGALELPEVEIEIR